MCKGLFDTDGCVRFEKNRTKIRYYPRIEFSSASKALRNDLILLFNELGFKSYGWQNKRKDGEEFRVSLAGFAQLDKWIREINSSNLKHLSRIKNGLLNKYKVSLKIKSQIFKRH
ncbi:LAGLIDADG family homing endonuclease [Candidatus Pacearchaeota archaeon]|nr:LAGLIDADG family homing endonuclease [Candidatus Pacearchaeota archaeon]